MNVTTTAQAEVSASSLRIAQAQETTSDAGRFPVYVVLRMHAGQALSSSYAPGVVSQVLGMEASALDMICERLQLSCTLVC